MSEIPKKIKKRKPIWLFFIVVFAVVVVLVDFQFFQYRWRPDTHTLLVIYSLSTHLFSIGFFIYLIIYTISYLMHKALKVIAIIGSSLSILVLALLMLIFPLLSPMPEITLKPEGYNHTYYLYPQSGFFTRRGYSVYVPDSDYTMVLYDGDVAMDFDTAYVSNNTYCIKFDGMDRLFRAESDHLYKFDLSKPQY
jgi:magnesium-transporting ATPase (P-type)